MNLSRFWSYVTVGTADEHWPWTGAKTGKGYGALLHKGKTVSARRIAWELTVGPIPAGQDVFALDGCPHDCCNPDHMFLASRGDNLRP